MEDKTDKETEEGESEKALKCPRQTISKCVCCDFLTKLVEVSEKRIFLFIIFAAETRNLGKNNTNYVQFT